MAVTMKQLLTQAQWMGHNLGAETESMVAGVRRTVRKCKSCKRRLVVDGGGFYGAAYNTECSTVSKPRIYFR